MAPLLVLVAGLIWSPAGQSGPSPDVEASAACDSQVVEIPDSEILLDQGEIDPVTLLTEGESETIPPPSIRTEPPGPSCETFVGQHPTRDEILEFVPGGVKPGPESLPLLLADDFLASLLPQAESAITCVAKGIKTQPEFRSRGEFDAHRQALRRSCDAREAQTRVAALIAERIPRSSAAERADWSAWLLSNLLFWAALSQ